MRPPDGYAETPEGLVLIADGINPVVRWDGIAAQAYPVGVTAPVTALTAAADPAALDPRPAAPLTGPALIKDPAATAPALPSTPSPPTLARDSSRDVQYANGDDPTTLLVNYPPGKALKGSYRCAMRYVDKDGNYSNWSALSAVLVVTRVALTAYPPNTFALKYTGVPVPSDARVLRRQIAINANLATSAAGNVSGAGDTANATGYYYLDQDTTDVTSTTLLSSETITRSGHLASLSAATRVDLVTASVATPFTGSYFAYVRYYDALGRFSDFSPATAVLALATADLCYGFKYTGVPVPSDPDVVGRQILRNAGGDSSRFYVDVDSRDLAATTFTSARSDLELARQELATDLQRTPGISGTFTAYSRFVNERGSYSDLSPVSAELVLHDGDYVYGLTYTNVPVPTQANVVRRQILRNTSGQANAYYVDVDTTDLVSTTFSSTKLDDELASGEAAPLFADDGLTPLANTRGVPVDYKTVLAHHSGRMFLAVDRTVSGGGIAVTGGSTSVSGLNTEWTASLVGRELWAKGATAAYTITAVDVAAQVLTLSAAYGGATDPYAEYAIRPAPAQRRLVYYTEAASVESWPAVNALSLQEDGDEITGLMVKDSFVFFVEERHVYRFTFQSDPAVDGFVYLSVNRGCVNNRCWALADGNAYMLDHAGVHAFAGGDETKSVSGPIQSMFTLLSDGPKIYWPAQELFHAAHYPDERLIRWFVCLYGERLPRHALCLDYDDDNRWWVEEYDRPVASSATAAYRNRRRVFAGTDAGLCVLTQEGKLDGTDDSAENTRGTVSSASAYRLTDVRASWPLALAGLSVTIASGRGVGQRRRITGQTADTLLLRDPWLVLPDATSTYQLGGISWSWKCGWMRFTPDEEEVQRKVEVLYEPSRRVAQPPKLRMRVYKDFSDDPVAWPKTTKAAAGEGFAVTAGSPDLEADMSQARGFAQQRIPGHKDMNLEGSRYISVELAGTSCPREDQALYHVAFDGVRG